MYLRWLWDQCTMEFMQRKNKLNQSQVSWQCAVFEGVTLNFLQCLSLCPRHEWVPVILSKRAEWEKEYSSLLHIKETGGGFSLAHRQDLLCNHFFFYVLSLWSEPVTHPNSHTSPIIVNKMENLRRTVNMGRLKNKQNIA